MNSQRRVTLVAILFLLMGIVAGLVWMWLANPAQWEVRANDIVLTEGAAKAQFSVIVVFVVIGLVGSLLAGLASAWMLYDVGWIITPIVAVLALVASVVAWRVGVELGSPNPSTVADASVGDTISAQLKVDAIGAFVVWPAAAVLGAIVGICLDRRYDNEQEVREPVIHG